MTVNLSKDNDLFSPKSIRSALKAWKKPKKLGEHDLAKLNIVDARLREERYPDTSDGYGLALRGLLREAIEANRRQRRFETMLARR